MVQPPGPSGFCPSQAHLKEAVGCPSLDLDNRLLSSLTKYVNLLAAGHAPPSVTPHLCGSCQLEVEWPIAAGEVLRRLCFQVSCHCSIVTPFQLVGWVCEAIIHAMKSSPVDNHWFLY